MTATHGYAPTTDESRLSWIENFDNKLGNYASTVGVTTAEVASVHADTLMFTFIMLYLGVITTKKENVTAYKNLLIHNPGNVQLGAIPALPTLPTAPAAVTAGIFDRMSLLVQRIKKHGNYNEAMGHDLKIIGADDTVDRVAMKPTLEIVISGGEPIIKWKKGHADAIRIEVDRGDNQGWQFLAVSTIPGGFHDKQAYPAAAATWKYRAIYLIADEPVGQMSDEAKITVP